MFPQNIIRHGLNNLNILLDSCSRLPLIGMQRFMSNKNETFGRKSAKEENDILYKKIMIETRSADREVLESYQTFVLTAAKHLGIPLSRTWQPFRHIQRRTLLRSAFVKKKYRVQYEWRTYFRNMEFKHLTGSTASTFLEYIERNLPEGVLAKVTKERIEPLFATLKRPKISQQQTPQQSQKQSQ